MAYIVLMCRQAITRSLTCMKGLGLTSTPQDSEKHVFLDGFWEFIGFWALLGFWIFLFERVVGKLIG